MPIPPLRIGDGKIANAVSLSLAGVVEVQICDRLRMLWNGRMELISD
jgi:hypothetical protein